MKRFFTALLASSALLAAPAPALAAFGTPTYLGLNGKSGTTNQTIVTVGSAVATGELVVVYVNYQRSDQSITGVIDSKSNTYTCGTPYSSGASIGHVAICYSYIANALTTSDTITGQTSNSNTNALYVHAWTVSGSGALDVRQPGNHNASSSTLSWSAAAPVGSTARNITFMFGTNNTSRSYTDTTWTEGHTDPTNFPVWYIITNAAASLPSSSFTLSGASTWITIGATFTEASAPPPSTSYGAMTLLGVGN